MNETILFPDLGKFFWPIIKGLLPVLPIFLIALTLRIFEFLVPEKVIKYFLKKHRIEFLTLLFAMAGYTISYIFLEKPELSFFFGIVVTFGATVVLVYSKVKENDFYFLPLRRNDEKDDWMGDGVFGYERIHDAFAITGSDSGFIFSKCLTWSDYVLEFDFKILNTSLGVILRSTNLSNLVMLQIFEDRLKAHIRINGFWYFWEAKETNLFFKDKLCFDNWYRGRFYCDKRSIRIVFYDMDDSNLFDRVWKIPSGKISFPLDIDQKTEFPTKVVTPSIPFSINLEYGTIGFRNFNEEKAIIKNVLMEKLNGENNFSQKSYSEDKQKDPAS